MSLGHCDGFLLIGVPEEFGPRGSQCQVRKAPCWFGCLVLFSDCILQSVCGQV